MKLKNLLFATMVACAFTACSNENDPIDNVTPPAPEAADATIDFATTTKALGTKALRTDGNATATDDKVYSLTAVIFNELGTEMVGYKRVEGNEGAVLTNLEVTGIKTKAVKIKALLIANLPEETLQGLSNVTAYTAKIQAYGTGVAFDASTPMIMSSGVLTSTAALSSEGRNKLGYGTVAGSDVAVNVGITDNAAVMLYRTAARVELVSVATTDLVASNISSIQVTKVFMSNVMSDSKIASEDVNGTVYGTGGLVRGDDDGMLGDLLVDGAAKTDAKVTSLTKEYQNGFDSADKSIFYILSYDAQKAATSAGTKALTLLCIKAKVTYTNGAVAADRYYTVKVGDAGTLNAGAAIARNTVYQIVATLKGNGSDNPYTPEASASLDAKVVVADWSVVSSAPEIE